MTVAIAQKVGSFQYFLPIKLHIPVVLVHDAAHGAVRAACGRRHRRGSPGGRGAPGPSGNLVQGKEARLGANVYFSLPFWHHILRKVLYLKVFTCGEAMQAYV